MIIPIRPVNGIIILALPFLVGNKESFLEAIAAVKKKKEFILYSSFFFLLFCIPRIQLSPFIGRQATTLCIHMVLNIWIYFANRISWIFSSEKRIVHLHPLHS